METKTVFKNFIYVALLFLILGILTCGKKSPTGPEKDTQAPSVSIVFPPSNSVIGDTLLIQVNASDNIGVTKVEFYIDGDHQADGDDTSEPFEYLWIATGLERGITHSLFAKAYDEANNFAYSDTINFYYQWILLLQDSNEPFARDLNKIYVRSTASMLEFRVEVNDQWGEPHSVSDGIDCGICLDVDQNPNTGLIPDTSYWLYQANDIGADYLSIVGVEGDSLWQWNSTDTSWQSFATLNYLNMESNSNYFELGIDLSDLDNPNIVDIVVGNITFETDSIYWDWAPDIGHATYTIDGSYIGKSSLALIKSTRYSSYHQRIEGGFLRKR